MRGLIASTEGPKDADSPEEEELSGGPAGRLSTPLMPRRPAHRLGRWEWRQCEVENASRSRQAGSIEPAAVVRGHRIHSVFKSSFHVRALFVDRYTHYSHIHACTVGARTTLT